MRCGLLVSRVAIGLYGCAPFTGSTGERPTGANGWCAVAVTNESGRPLALRYYTGAGGTGEVTVGEVAVGSTAEFSARCELGTIRVLGYPVEAGRRTLVARTGEIRLDPVRRVRGALREVL